MPSQYELRVRLIEEGKYYEINKEISWYHVYLKFKLLEMKINNTLVANEIAPLLKSTINQIIRCLANIATALFIHCNKLYLSLIYINPLMAITQTIIVYLRI